MRPAPPRPRVRRVDADAAGCCERRVTYISLFWLREVPYGIILAGMKAAAHNHAAVGACCYDLPYRSYEIYPLFGIKIALRIGRKDRGIARTPTPRAVIWTSMAGRLEHVHRTCRETLFESSPTSSSRTFEPGTTSAALGGGQALSNIKIMGQDTTLGIPLFPKSM